MLRPKLGLRPKFSRTRHSSAGNYQCYTPKLLVLYVFPCSAFSDTTHLWVARISKS